MTGRNRRLAPEGAVLLEHRAHPPGPCAGGRGSGSWGRAGRCPRGASSRCGRRASGSCWTTGSPSRLPGIGRFETGDLGDLPGAGKKRAAFRSPSCPKKGSIPFPGRGPENPAQAQRPGGVGKASEPPHFLESSPVPCEPARSFIGGPGEPDNRRWLALKQSGNPLHFAGPPTAGNGAPPAPEGS